MGTEKHTGLVVANNDPESRGRIRAICAELTGDSEAELPVWIEPVLDWGWFVVPDVDEIVELEVVTAGEHDESAGQSTIYDPDIRWRGKRYYHDVEEAPTPIHSDFTSSNYGKRRGFATPTGHILMFDDTEGQARINLTWHQVEEGSDKYAYLSMDPDGSIVIGNKNGSLIYLDAKNGAITIVDEHGNSISSDTNGIKLIDKRSNIVELKDGAIQILSKGGVAISCKDAKLNAGNVELGQVAELGVARQTDLVSPGTTMATWIAAVSTALALTLPTDFGIITSGSTVVKAE